jgi:hypothetical protein
VGKAHGTGVANTKCAAAVVEEEVMNVKRYDDGLEYSDGKYVLATDYKLLEDERDGLLDELEKWVKKHDALKEQRDFSVSELEAILFMLHREKGKEEK